MGHSERFMDMVMPEPNSGCWLWTGYVDCSWGYGQVPFRGDKYGGRTAHRVSYVLFVGAVPEGMLVLHKCDVRCCVNPDHLFVGTHRDNQQDKCRKGRHGNQLKTHCAQGHEYTPENTRIRKNGWRVCRACKKMRYRQGGEAEKKDTPITVLNT